MGGDFNEILSNEEKCGGLIRAPALMEGFQNGLEDCGLVDLGLSGSLIRGPIKGLIQTLCVVDLIGSVGTMHGVTSLLWQGCII